MHLTLSSVEGSSLFTTSMDFPDCMSTSCNSKGKSPRNKSVPKSMIQIIKNLCDADRGSEWDCLTLMYIDKLGKPIIGPIKKIGARKRKSFRNGKSVLKFKHLFLWTNTYKLISNYRTEIQWFFC